MHVWLASNRSSYAHVHAHTYTYIHTYQSCMHSCIHAYMHTCMHACIHAYMHTCIHAHTHTHASRWPPRRRRRRRQRQGGRRPDSRTSMRINVHQHVSVYACGHPNDSWTPRRLMRTPQRLILAREHPNAPSTQFQATDSQVESPRPLQAQHLPCLQPLPTSVPLELRPCNQRSRPS